MDGNLYITSGYLTVIKKLLQQAAEKASYASLRSIGLTATYWLSTPLLVDFSRASPLSLFEQLQTQYLSNPLGEKFVRGEKEKGAGTF
jgi:hypothetical protein